MGIKLFRSIGTHCKKEKQMKSSKVFSEDESRAAIRNYIPYEPHKVELGGDIYYKCHWITCDCEIHTYDNFCPKCGQRIDWRGINE